MANVELDTTIRDKLKEMGIMLEDQGGKTIWKKM